MANYYRIEVRRTIYCVGTLDIEADDEGEARELAMDMLSEIPNDDERWEPFDESDSIISVEEEAASNVR